jgi:hypothetical protein
MKNAPTYIIQDSIRLENCINFLRGLNLEKAWEINIKPYAKKRSEAQNRTYWAFLNVMAEHTGHDKDDLHEIFKAEFLGMKTVKAMGKIAILPRGTSELTTKEFADYLRKIEDVAVNMGIRLPYPDDYKFVTEIGGKAPKAAIPAPSIP